MKDRPTQFAVCERGVRITVHAVPKASRASRAPINGAETGAGGQAYFKVREPAALLRKLEAWLKQQTGEH